MITLQLPWLCNYMQQIIKIIQPFPEILAYCYFGKHLVCPSMPGHTKHVLHDLTAAFMDIKLHTKNEHYTSNSLWYQTLKNPEIWLADSILSYHLRIRLFFPDMRFSQNHIANYGAPLKAKKKIMLPSPNILLLVQICLVNPITYTTNTIFQNPAL